MSVSEVVLIALVVIVIFAIGQYGRKTTLGYTGSVIVCLLATPLVGFAVVYYLRSKSSGR